MRLPKDQDNWTGWHVDKALAEARKQFERYEARIDFTWPREKQDDCYRPYQMARELAVTVARATNYRVQEAERLP
jgi:hypothetical protein